MCFDDLRQIRLSTGSVSTREKDPSRSYRWWSHRRSRCVGHNFILALAILSEEETSCGYLGPPRETRPVNFESFCSTVHKISSFNCIYRLHARFKCHSDRLYPRRHGPIAARVPWSHSTCSFSPRHRLKCLLPADGATLFHARRFERFNMVRHVIRSTHKHRPQSCPRKRRGYYLPE